MTLEKDNMSRKIFALALLVCWTTAGLCQTGTVSQSQTHPQPPRHRMIRVSAETIPRYLQQSELPKYPHAALASGGQGEVILKVDIDETGRVVLCDPVIGDPLLIAAS